ncbi:cytochrome P450 4F12-like [Babylonia areolata]|uniref:cytochrome P450 4F12-like n=1 Tax=Babylonia areolata TaxID=304850 RepID=UPI003FD63B7C
MLEDWSAVSVMWTVVLVAVTMVAVRCVRWLWAYLSFVRFFSSLPGEDDFSWVWGNLHKIRGQRTEGRLRYFAELTEKFPKFYLLWLGPFRVNVMLHHPDTLRALLKTAGPKPWSYGCLKPWLGEGLLTTRGPRWQRSRRLLTPAFHFNILKPYNTISNRACDLLLDKVEKHAMEKRSMEMFGNISLCTFDVILQCAMSYKDDVQTQGESHPYIQAVNELSELAADRIRNPLVHWDWAYALTAQGKKNRQLCDFVHGIAERIIAARLQTLEQDGPPKKRYLDFLDLLLTAKDENGKGLTPIEIRDEVDTFMFEGHDTTASAVSWTLHSLSEHPDIQNKVQQEVDRVLQGRDSDDIEWDDLSQLEYLTMVIKEGMRLHCPVPGVARHLTEPLTVEGVTLPVDTVCSISIQNLHHNPTVWPDPYVFNPDRFHPENAKGRDSYAFVPFSAGPRNCIGQHFAMNEQKVVLARLLRRFTFSPDPSVKVEKNMAAVMRTERGMKMFAVPRLPSL